MPTRDARGTLLVFWGCHACHTLNEPDHTTCTHCAAARPRGATPRRWAGVSVAVAAVAALVVVSSARLTPSPEPLPTAAAPIRAPRAAPAVTPEPAPEPVPVVVAPPPPAAAVTAVALAVSMADHEVRRPATRDDSTLPIVEVVSVTWVNVRSAPTPTAAIVGVIKPQTSAQRLGARAGWVQLRTDTLVGWVYAQGLTER